MDEALDSLESILRALEKEQEGKDDERTKKLLEEAQACLATIREEYRDLWGSYMELTEHF